MLLFVGYYIWGMYFVSYKHSLKHRAANATLGRRLYIGYTFPFSREIVPAWSIKCYFLLEIICRVCILFSTSTRSSVEQQMLLCVGDHASGIYRFYEKSFHSAV